MQRRLTNGWNSMTFTEHRCINRAGGTQLRNVRSQEVSGVMSSSLTTKLHVYRSHRCNQTATWDRLDLELRAHMIQPGCNIKTREVPNMSKYGLFDEYHFIKLRITILYNVVPNLHKLAFFCRSSKKLFRNPKQPWIPLTFIVKKQFFYQNIIFCLPQKKKPI